MENSQNTVVMPRELTADNGAKAALMGEFFIETLMACVECDPEDEESCSDCPVCDGDGQVWQKLPIPWDTIKDIYRKAVEVCGQPAAAPAQAELEPANLKAWCAIKSEFICTTPKRCHESGHCASRS